MRLRHILACGIASVATVALSVSLLAQKSTPPKARYQMDVSTTSGIGAMGTGMGGAMSMMFGGGKNAEQRQLELRLGSTLGPTPPPAKADHFMPEGMKLGLSVPLVTPEPVKPGKPAPSERDPERDFQRPKGRLLLFWGCGAKAGPGQPVILDFAKMAAGQVPPNLFSARVPVDRSGPQFSNSRTFGDWPNAKSNKPLPKQASLIGEHRIAGSYTPEIKFALTQDFMPAIKGNASELPGGATNLTWNSVAAATGYYAYTISFQGDGQDKADIVWWTSSARQEFGGGLWDWLPPATVQRLIGEKVVLPPTQTSCTIPAEVRAAGGQFMMTSLYAYGPEANFAYPPRPANPKLVWNPEWTARVRYRSTTTFFNGMPGMGDAAASEDESAASDAKDKKKKKKNCGLGGAILGGVLGTGC